MATGLYVTSGTSGEIYGKTLYFIEGPPAHILSAMSSTILLLYLAEIYTINNMPIQKYCAQVMLY